MAELELDPRWEWVEVSSLDDLAAGRPHFVKGRCNHLQVVPVTNVEGVEVAQLCLTCDAQFQPSWEPD